MLQTSLPDHQTLNKVTIKKQLLCVQSNAEFLCTSIHLQVLYCIVLIWVCVTLKYIALK